MKKCEVLELHLKLRHKETNCPLERSMVSVSCCVFVFEDIEGYDVFFLGFISPRLLFDVSLDSFEVVSK